MALRVRMSRTPVSKRGRPLKFGRTSQLVTLTLPTDVVEWLETVDADLAWAIVKLHQRAARQASSKRVEVAGLVQLPGNRALILVRPEFFNRLVGVSLIPLADGRAFLALEHAKGVADLELAVIDRLDAKGVATTERDALTHIRTLLKKWRQEGIQFESRSLIVAQRSKSAGRGRALSPIESSNERD